MLNLFQSHYTTTFIGILKCYRQKIIDFSMEINLNEVMYKIIKRDAYITDPCGTPVIKKLIHSFYTISNEIPRAVESSNTGF